MAIVLFLLGYFLYVRKIPIETGLPNSNNKLQDINNLGRSIWTILLTIAIILVFKIQVHIAVIMIIALNFIIDKFSWKEIRPMFSSAFESKLIFSTIVIMMFKDVLTYNRSNRQIAGGIRRIACSDSGHICSCFLYWNNSCGRTGHNRTGHSSGIRRYACRRVALMVLLMCMTYIAMQVSPAHICLAIVTERFETSFIDLVKRTIPVMILFLVIMSGYKFCIIFVSIGNVRSCIARNKEWPRMLERIFRHFFAWVRPIYTLEVFQV